MMVRYNIITTNDVPAKRLRVDGRRCLLVSDAIVSFAINIVREQLRQIRHDKRDSPTRPDLETRISTLDESMSRYFHNQRRLAEITRRTRDDCRSANETSTHDVAGKRYDRNSAKPRYINNYIVGIR